MSTSTKTRATIRQGGPGASHENAQAPLEIEKPEPSGHRRHSAVSGGGGERDKHHSHDPYLKAGKTRKERA
jgi:hypothetical protein